MKSVLKISLLLIFFFSLGSVAIAQSAGVGFNSTVVIDMYPKVPGPNTDVTLSIQSFSYDLDRSDITWLLNGVKMKSGKGIKDFSFTTGNVGKKTSFTYQIDTPNGVSFSKTIDIIPGEVSVLAEAVGYTPPFYKGKTLFVHQGNARLVAVPNLIDANGNKYDPNKLVYTWKTNLGTIAGSGYGKSSIIYEGSVISRPTEIKVEVSDEDKTIYAEGSVIISPKQGELVVYEISPSLGILFNNALSDRFSMTSQESTFVAVPYYFTNPFEDGTFEWQTNGETTAETSNTITFRNTTKSKGMTSVNVSFTNQVKFLQAEMKDFNVFAEDIKSGFFNNLFGN